jgi:hypothetical protein
LLRLLSDFESGVGSLKALAAQRQILQSQLQERETQLTAKDAELRTQGEEIATLREALQGREHELHGLEDQLRQAERELADRKKALEAEKKAHADDVRKANAEAQARRDELHAVEHRLSGTEQALRESKQALEMEKASHEADVQSARREAALRTKEQDAREAELLRTIEEQAQKSAELAHREDTLHAHEGDLRERAEQLASERTQLDALRSQLEALRAQLDDRTQQLTKESEQLKAQAHSLHVLGQQLDARQEQLTDRLRAADQQQKQVEQSKQALQQAQASHEQALATLHKQQQEAQGHRAKLEAREQELQTQASTLAQREQALAQIERLRREVQARQQAAEAALARATALESECEQRTTQMLHELQEMQLHADEHQATAQTLTQKLAQVEQALALATTAAETERARTAEVTKQSRERLEQMRSQLETSFARRLESEKAAAADAARREAAQERLELEAQLATKLQAALAQAGPSEDEVQALLAGALAEQQAELEARFASQLDSARQASSTQQLEAARAQWEQQAARDLETLRQNSQRTLEAKLHEQRTQLELSFSRTLAERLEEQAGALRSQQTDVEASQQAMLEKWRNERAKLEEAAQREIAAALEAQRRELEARASAALEHALAQREATLHEQSEARLAQAMQQAREHAEAVLARQREQSESHLRSALDAALAEQRAEHEKALHTLRSKLHEESQAHGTASRELWEREAQLHLHTSLQQQESKLLEQAAMERDALLAKFEERLRDELTAIDNASVLGAENAIKLQREQMQQSFDSQLQHALLSEKGRMQRELQSLLSVVEEYEQLWHIERHEAARLTNDFAKASQDAQEADHVVGVLRDKLREELGQRKAIAEQMERATLQAGELQLTVDDLRTQLARAKSEGAARRSEQFLADPVAVTRRRRRLRQMRDLATQRQAKLREAGEALQHRYEQCELVLRNRSELAAARERIIEAERRVQRRMAGSKVGVLVLCAMGTFATVGLLSWAIAKQVAPATFIATSMVSADGRGRTLSERDLTSWQSYHETILTDPRFHQFASDRFQKAGMESLSTASSVSEFISSRIRHEERNPGEMKLHLTMQGRRAAERTLDTFTAAMTAFANTNQIQRVDGSVTKVAEASSTGGEPVDNAQTYYALSIMGSLTALVMGVSIAVWRRLARAKTAFERDTHLAGVLDDAKWGGPKVLDSFKQAPQAKKAA